MRSRLSTVATLLLFVVSLPLRAQKPGSVTVSDAAYAEVSALSYAALREAAVEIRDDLNNATSSETTVVLLTPDMIDGQVALSAAVAQLSSVNDRLCTLLRPSALPTPPAGRFHPEFSGSADVGTIASGLAAVAQLFTPHGSSASTAIEPDTTALIADLFAVGRPVILPDLNVPAVSDLAADQPEAQHPCDRTYLGALANGPQDVPTLWLAAQTSAARIRAAQKPTDDMKAALSAFDDLARSYLAVDPKNGSLYAQLLRSQALRRYLDPAKKPVVMVLGIDSMGGTTSEAGKTSFTSHIKYSGGVVVHFIAWQLSPDAPMRPVAGGTITKTVTSQSESDLQPYLNH